MDPVTLAAGAVAALVPDLANAALAKASEAIVEGSGTLLKWLGEKLVGQAKEAFEELIANPEDHDNRAVLRKQLTKTLTDEPQLQGELEALLRTMPAMLSQTVSGRGAMGTQISGSGNEVILTNRMRH